MPHYTAPLDDFRFLLYDVLHVEQYAEHVPGFGEAPREMVEAILAEGAKFCEEVLFPLNQSGDAKGCRFKDGKVTTPKGFKQAYKAYVKGGWPSFTCDPEYGGQGLPEVFGMPMIEMICSANLAFGITPGLSHGAVDALMQHGSDTLKKRYLPKLVSGEWTGVMCLTEPQAGTDLGLIRTTAKAQRGRSYRINGTKIFISSGEHDMAENILHLVLARLPDAPAGTKGISLFLVPKMLVKSDGSLGEPNAVSCAAIEEKMGIHASPTCVMNYDGATGYLVGEKHQGMKAMFTMMNAARLYVGVQGLGLAEAACQNASAYARERLQGRRITGAMMPEKAADPIIVHADVRRMLLSMRAFTEGARMLSMLTALMIDFSRRHPDPDTRAQAEAFVQLMTPVVKAHLTDGGSEAANLAMQVFGGYGYIREYGVEQYVRDARIAQIYEGANGIQALDLIGRKLSRDYGKLLRAFFHPLDAFLRQNAGVPGMAEFVEPLKLHMAYLQQGSLWLAQKGLGNPEEAAAGATEYLRMFGTVALGYMWALMAATALRKRQEGEGDVAFYDAKLVTARFYMRKILPQTPGLLGSVTAGATPVMAMEDAYF